MPTEDAQVVERVKEQAERRLGKGGGITPSRKLQSRVLSYVRSFRGIAVCRKDVQDDTGISAKVASYALGELVRQGKLAAKTDPDCKARVLFYDPKAWDEGWDVQIGGWR